MSEEDLELLITLDDPEGAPQEDIFHTSGREYARVLDWSADYDKGQRETTGALHKQQE
ncbi:MAG TPA: hypothetical protein VLA93_00450 [Pyrinomonadaceae bacterium]|nr:hypothetical protein [Pyrinomonadaceae bacterium]